MLSYTKLNTFSTCKRKFKYQYIDKIKVERKTCFVRGSSIHKLCELYGTDKFEEAFKAADPEISGVFDRFINSDIGKSCFVGRGLSEVKIGLNEDLEATSETSPYMVGFIDRIQRVGDSIELIDFKTGKYVIEAFQTYKQLQIYALWFFNRYKNIDEVKLRYVYVDAQKENTLIFKRSDLKFFRNKLSIEIKDLNECVEYPKSTDPKKSFCFWCEYKDICSSDKE